MSSVFIFAHRFSVTWERKRRLQCTAESRASCVVVTSFQQSALFHYNGTSFVAFLSPSPPSPCPSVLWCRPHMRAFREMITKKEELPEKAQKSLSIAQSKMFVFQPRLNLISLIWEFLSFVFFFWFPLPSHFCRSLSSWIFDFSLCSTSPWMS